MMNYKPLEIINIKHANFTSECKILPSILNVIFHFCSEGV